MTVRDLIKALTGLPPDTPVFTYNLDKQMDGSIDMVLLEGPHFDVGDDGRVIQTIPTYCKGHSRVQEYWDEHGVGPVIYLVEE